MMDVSWDSLTWTLVVFVVILLLTRYLIKQSKLPPGPWGLPFIGYALFIDDKRRPQHIHELCERHKTRVMSMTLFGNTMLFLDDYDLIKEIFQRRTDVADRPEVDFFKIFDDDYSGVVGTSNRTWREQRRFIVNMLRDFGMGKLASESYIHSETQALMTVFKSHKNQPFNPQTYVNMAISNVTNSMVFGKRFEYDDAEFQKALNDINGVVRLFSSPGLYFLLKSRFGKILAANKFNTLMDFYNGFTGFVSKQIKEHTERYDGTVNDLIDGYLKEMEERKDHSIFNEKSLLYVIVDVFVAGSETTSTTLRWALLYLAAYPDMQKKIYQELSQVVDTDRLPNSSDKKNTPYTEAVLCEIQRVNTLLVFGLGHTCLKGDFDVDGYTIPQATILAANLYQVHNDTRFWKNPEIFDPGNFLDDDGQVINQERLVQFSIGRRSCAGEALARMELYLFFTSWVQKFRVELASQTDLKGLFLGVFTPQDFLIRMIER